jgi:hypothetical protein
MPGPALPQLDARTGQVAATQLLRGRFVAWERRGSRKTVQAPSQSRLQ